MSKVVGDKIRNIRLGGNKHNKVYNQKEFADEIGATLQAVSNWENNRNKPNSYRLRALAELGEITVDELLGNSVKSVGLNKAVGSRIRSIRTNILGLSMSDFGKKIDSSAKSGTVANWETGKNLPNNNRLLKIAKLGNITVDELLGNTCQLCNGQMLTADFYEEKSELFTRYVVTEDRKIITHVYAEEEYLGFSEIDISYCPECGRKLEVKQ